jgi:hypothetical protein
MDASILHRKPCFLALLALHLPQPHVPTTLRPNRIKTWHSNYGLRSIKNQKKNIFLLTSVVRSAHTMTLLGPDGDAPLVGAAKRKSKIASNIGLQGS